VKITGIFLLLVVFLSIQAPVFALTESPAQVLIQTPTGSEHANVEILPQISDYNLEFVYRDTNFEEMSGQDMSLVYVYDSEDGPSVWVSVEIAKIRSSLHRWEACLVIYPLLEGLTPSVTQLDLREIQIQENPPILAKYFAFQDHQTNQTQVVLYWYETATFNRNETYEQKYVKMSLIIYPSENQTVAEAENQLLPLAIAINEYWQPIKTWTQITLVISQNGLSLIGVTSIVLVALVFYRLLLNRKAKLSLLRLYGKLPEQGKLLVKAVQNAQNLGASNSMAVANEFRKLTETESSEAFVASKLEEAENAGLIRKVITSKNDVPTINWKSINFQKTGILNLIRRKIKM
jgi:hypothetical protein